MPLKHVTETVLIGVLGVVMILTGVALATLPNLPAGALPWGIVCAFTLAYAFGFYPMLRSNRADYEFRLLHFMPALIAVLWLLFQFLDQSTPGMHFLARSLTWGYSAAAVAVCFLLLVAFCLHVIRRRVPRIAVLVLLFVPYAFAAIATESALHWDKQLAALVWGGWTSTGADIVRGGSGQLAKQQGSSLPTSANPQEEEWRKKLREREQSEQQASSKRSSASAVIASASSSSRVPVIKPKPGTLPSAGAGMEVLGPGVLAAYCGVLHRRAKRRV